MRRWSLPILLCLAAPPVFAGVVDGLLEGYRGAGAGPFSAEAGEAMWHAVQSVEGESRRCTDCHGDDLKQPGEHRRTGKTIEPMAPSVNAGRLTDERKIEKWFLRNCKWTVGRECTPQEKGDFLLFLRDL